MCTSSTTRITYNGTVCFKYNGNDYEAEVRAGADYFYQPCVMYFKDGTGQPEDSDLTVEELTVETLLNVDTDEDMIKKYENDKAFRDCIDEIIDNQLLEMDMDEWTFPDESGEDVDDYLDRMDEERHFGYGA